MPRPDFDDIPPIIRLQEDAEDGFIFSAEIDSIIDTFGNILLVFAVLFFATHILIWAAR